MRTITLEYHDVLPEADFAASGFSDAGADSYKLSPERFEAHLDAVAREAGASCVGLAAETAAGHGARVLLTFDDGGASADDIGRRLERRGWRGHFFMTTDFIGAPGFLDADDLRALHARGHVIGSHSASHPARMSALPRERIADEWRRSCDALAAILGVPTTVASVPGGFLSRAVVEAAAACGIRTLFTSEPTTRIVAIGGCRLIGRYTLRREDAASVAASLVRPRSRERTRQRATWEAKKLIKLISGPTYMPLRALILGKG